MPKTMKPEQRREVLAILVRAGTALAEVVAWMDDERLEARDAAAFSDCAQALKRVGARVAAVEPA